ncbi:hypothetical protein OB920_19630 [Halobacteria archaeon HArc-gm2]|nr:hypothetical protein [Halobacteria archaeon HArc-gm2]
MATLSSDDEGKFLVDAEDEQIGIVTEVDADANVAYVDPDPGIGEAWLEGFGYGDADEDDIRVPFDAVSTVTDEEIRVPRDL